METLESSLVAHAHAFGLHFQVVGYTGIVMYQKGEMETEIIKSHITKIILIK